MPIMVQCVDGGHLLVHLVHLDLGRFFRPLICFNDTASCPAQVGLRSFLHSGGESDFAALFAMSTLSLPPVFVLFLFFQRLVVNGIATTSRKG
jgi:multiple sugar transport system permease protein